MMSLRPGLLLLLAGQLACSSHASGTSDASSPDSSTHSRGSATDGGRDATTMPGPSRVVTLMVDPTTAVAQIDAHYLSVAVDTAQVVGADWWNLTGNAHDPTVKVPVYDFTRPALLVLAAGLSPALLRIGGTEADRVYYDLSAAPVTTPPAPYVDVLTQTLWDGVNRFAMDVGFQVVFTLNAGPGPRDATGAWTPANAKTLLDYTEAHGYPLFAWELGNEVNMYPLSLGITVSPAQFVADAVAARDVVNAEALNTKLVAPASMYWPKTGEVLPFYPGAMEAGVGASLDAVTWHYYPQQSLRCPITPTPATLDAGMLPGFLGEIDTWAAEVESGRATYAPGKQVWLGETGNAQCGGQPGVSNVFESGFWWLDELARLARRGESYVFRHTLSGADYGLIDDATLTPRPDYWTSVLWKRLIGTGVLAVAPPADPALLAYAHCTPRQAPGYTAGAVTLVVLNLDRTSAVSLPLASLAPSGDALVYELSAPDLASSEIDLNGTALAVTAAGELPPLAPRTQTRGADGSLDVTFARATYGFVVLPGASAAACL